MAEINLNIYNYNTTYDEPSFFSKSGSRNFVINSLNFPIDVNQALDLFKKRHDNPGLVNNSKNYMKNITRKEKMKMRLKQKLEDKKNKSSANSE